jgi:hypothetical protein
MGPPAQGLGGRPSIASRVAVVHTVLDGFPCPVALEEAVDEEVLLEGRWIAFARLEIRKAGSEKGCAHGFRSLAKAGLRPGNLAEGYLRNA